MTTQREIVSAVGASAAVIGTSRSGGRGGGNQKEGRDRIGSIRGRRREMGRWRRGRMVMRMRMSMSMVGTVGGEREKKS